MDWIQAITLFFSLAGLLAGLLYWFKNDLEKGINRLDNDLKILSKRLEAETKEQTRRLEANTARTDQLYQMFIDLLKERRSHP